MNFHDAVKQFQDNLLRIGGTAAALKDPEKYNLYAGLANLALGLEQLQRDIQSLQRAIMTMR